MIFSSLEFLVFLVLVLAGLALLGTESQRRNLLLVASYVFYGWWDWRFCFLILASTVVDYWVGLGLYSTREQSKRRLLLMVSLVSNLGLLGFFKYSNFFLDSLRPALEDIGLTVPHLDIILPVGISFFTFQTMSYSIDIYRHELKPTRNFRDFALFVSFFPQLVAGPIVRGSEFLPQLDREHQFSWFSFRPGLEIFVRGFVKKILFADTLAYFVDPVFSHPDAYAASTCWLAVIAYAGQIYYDFSGYTDMAIGVGGMLGFDFPENFRHPYNSLNITEFWRRWHMSLSRWLRDYLYIPMGGNRKGRARAYVNLMMTMLLGGLWHGASWTFVAWGALHGGALALHKLLRERPGRRQLPVPSVVKLTASWLLNFLFVLVTWVFFRSQTFSDAFVMLNKMFSFDESGVRWHYVNAMIVLIIGGALHVYAALNQGRSLGINLQQPVGWSLLAFVLLIVLLYAPFGTNPFIYFQF